MSFDEAYSESLDTHPVLQAALAAVILFTAYLSLNPPPGSRVLNPALMLVLVITVALFINFRTLEISISGGRLTVGYGFIKSSIRLGDVLHAEAVKPPFWRYGGPGIRLGLDGSLGYVVDYRRGVRVTRRRGMPVFFSTGNPEKII
jgi:hypothetical protein